MKLLKLKAIWLILRSKSFIMVDLKKVEDQIQAVGGYSDYATSEVYAGITEKGAARIFAKLKTKLTDKIYNNK